MTAAKLAVTIPSSTVATSRLSGSAVVTSER
jgi:hypothetical protein